MGARSLTILVADEDEQTLRSTAALLGTLGHTVSESAVDVAAAAEIVARDEPDLSIVVVYDNAHKAHALDLLEEIGSFAGGPIIALLDHEDPDFVAEAADRGIDAYVRTPQPEPLQSAIEVAVRRHADRMALAEQVERLEGALARRALIERAKGILMERHQLGDRAAFDLMRDHARSRNRAVVDVAAAVVEGHSLLPPVREPAGD